MNTYRIVYMNVPNNGKGLVNGAPIVWVHEYKAKDFDAARDFMFAEAKKHTTANYAEIHKVTSEHTSTLDYHTSL